MHRLGCRDPRTPFFMSPVPLGRVWLALIIALTSGWSPSSVLSFSSIAQTVWVNNHTYIHYQI